MSIGTISQIEWLNRNSLRSFPLREDHPIAVVSADQKFVNSIIVDALIVDRSPSSVKTVVIGISFTRLTATVFLGDRTTRACSGYATAVIGLTAPNSPVKISGVDDLCSGSLTFGLALERADFNEFVGYHEQDVDLESRCIMKVGLPVVNSLSAGLDDSGGLTGDVSLSALGGFDLSISEELVDGSPQTVVVLSLSSPEEFLPDCYPKFLNPTCNCEGNPILTINGVPRSDSDLGVDIVFQGGLDGEIQSHPGSNLIELTVAQTGEQICDKTPVVPDEYGRIGPNYERDCPPVTSYGLDYSGPDCENEVNSIPFLEIEYVKIAQNGAIRVLEVGTLQTYIRTYEEDTF